ncbi:MAG: uroporphyrinogen-III synthase [Flavobacteriales bacterium]
MTSKTFKILSTKILDLEQKQFSDNLNVFYKDFISIQFLDFELPKQNTEATVFTSQNAVKAVSQKVSFIENDILCVGQKTAYLIEKLFSKKPEIISSSAKQLAQIILKENYQILTFFNGNLRRQELPLFLLSKKIDLKEITVYKTILTPHHIVQEFDGILFFSPSGVESYLKKNLFSKNTTIFAIGNTTADFIKQNGGKCIISKKPTIESVIETVNQYFNKNE